MCLCFSNYAFILMSLLQTITQIPDLRFLRFCLGESQVKNVSLFKVHLRKTIK